MQLALQSDKIFIASKAIDFRAGIDSLCVLVIKDMQQSPNSGLYIFYNKRLDKLKILGWHNNGFIMVYKKLDSGKFFLRTNGEQIQLNSDQLKWLLTGVDWRLLSHVECKNNDYF